MRMLAYGTPADLLDEGLRIAESTTIECLTEFVKGIRLNFGAEYLRRPTEDDHFMNSPCYSKQTTPFMIEKSITNSRPTWSSTYGKNLGMDKHSLICTPCLHRLALKIFYLQSLMLTFSVLPVSINI